MTISVNYQKRKNTILFNKLQTINNIKLTNIQNYIPIYDRFFSLNNTNWNSINLNHTWYISDIKESKIKDGEEHSFTCKREHINENKILTTNNQKVFIKMAPLLDPFKYIVGKYNHNDPQLFNLPSFDKSIKVHPKMNDPNNSSFIDGFFSFLTSKVLHEHKFIHGLDYYGSFLAIKNNYKVNIIDDIDYLISSDFFIKQKNILFKVDDYSHLITPEAKKHLQPLKFLSSLKSVMSVNSIDGTMFENIFETSLPLDETNNSISLGDMKNMGVNLVDITNSIKFDATNQINTETLKSGSTCSSRTSHTNDNDLSESDDDASDNEDTSDVSKLSESDREADNINTTITRCESVSSIGSNLELTDENDDLSDDDSTSSVEEETLFLTFPQFPVQVICMEQCENTFDDLIINGDLTDDEWFSALMQIIMVLITYQKMFSFTHNDLHTNNIMYVSTNIKFLYYIYKKKTYKVPTFGKIYKIIDFGRAIYKLKGNLFCSDSFQQGGDAATQYNTEPFFNEKKPCLEPNFSFDLCRLACSIFDYVVEDFDVIKNISECSPLVQLIVEWCIDDNGINVLYKNNGVERYPDFKLYKMIARHVHKHTPIAQLERKEFCKFIISNKNIPKTEQIINIDELPCYC